MKLRSDYGQKQRVLGTAGRENRINKLVRGYLEQTPIVNETKLGEGAERRILTRGNNRSE